MIQKNLIDLILGKSETQLCFIASQRTLLAIDVLSFYLGKLWLAVPK